MTKFKKNNYKFWHSPIVLLLLFCFFIFFAYNIINLVETERETHKKKEVILEEINNLKKKEMILSSNLAKIDTEEGVEEIIRDKYQVTKEGEKMIIIIDSDRNNIREKNISERPSFFKWITGLFR